MNIITKQLSELKSSIQAFTDSPSVGSVDASNPNLPRKSYADIAAIDIIQEVQNAVAQRFKNQKKLVTFPTRKQSILDLVYVSHHYYNAIVEDIPARPPPPPPPMASVGHHMVIMTLKDCFKQRLQKQYSIIDYAKLDQVLGQVN